MNIKNIRQILVLILILASFIFFFPWGGIPTAPEAYEPNLKPSHNLDAELPHSLQQAGVRALPQQYVEHEPIRIAKNEDFAALGFPGVGTPFTPYLIEGLNITSATRTLIRIKDTTAYFCIRNNLLNGSTDWDLIKWDYPLKEAYGIKLKHVTHGTIDSNLVINCERGILLNQSEQNTLINNTVAHNYDYGISLEHSKYSTITHNTVAHNHFKAISLANSGHSTLTQNNIT
ncbi:MAG: right-handed parallel beta-helix repeat-containing protein, partial [Candidatus Hodarchaeota archaeon]